jgi:hypothetical protein
MIMEQETQDPPDSRVWDDRATEILRKSVRCRQENGDVQR